MALTSVAELFNSITEMYKNGLITKEKAEQMIDAAATTPTFYEDDHPSRGSSRWPAYLAQERLMIGEVYCDTAAVFNVSSDYMPSSETGKMKALLDEERFVDCEYCGYDNAWVRTECNQCGGPLVHAKEV